MKIKQVGLNIILTLEDGKVLTKKIDNKEERDGLKASVAKYLEKPNAKAKAAILKVMTVEKTKIAEKEKVTKKVIKQAVKEENRAEKILKKAEKDSLTAEEIAYIKSELKKHIEKDAPQPQRAEPSRRRPEH
jgi:hypothetical protein